MILLWSDTTEPTHTLDIPVTRTSRTNEGMNNLPPELPPIEAYYYDEYTIKIDYEGFSPSGDITMQVSNFGKVIATYPGSFDAGRISIPLTIQQVQSMPPIAEYRITDGTSTIFTGLFKPVKEGRPDSGESFTVTVEGDTVVVVQVYALQLVTEQAEIATEKAEQTAADRVATGEDRTAVASDKATVASDKVIVAADKAATLAAKTAAEEARDVANDAQAGAEAARDETVQLLAQKMDFFSVNTYAALEAFIADPELGPCAIMVFFDETYGGLPRLHVYTGDVPVLGPKVVQFVTYSE